MAALMGAKCKKRNIHMTHRTVEPVLGRAGQKLRGD